MPVVALDVVLYAILFLVLALAFTSKKVVQGLFGPLIAALQKIPVIGAKLAAPFEAIVHGVTSVCGSIEAGVDGIIGVSWHTTARMLDWTLRELRGHATAIASIAAPLGTVVIVAHGLRSLVHRLTHVAHVGASGIRDLTRDFHHLRRRVRAIERDLANGIGDDVLPRIRSLDRELHKVTTQTIPAIQSGVAEAEQEVTALGEYIRAHYLPNTEEALAAATAVGLAALGLGGLRCNTLQNSLGKRGCGFWGDLENLLGIAFIPLELASIYALIETAQAVTPTITEVASDVLQV